MNPEAPTSRGGVLDRSVGERHRDAARHDTGFRHEALFYRGDDEYVAGTLPLIHRALEAEDPVLVAVGDERESLLRDALGGDAGNVAFADMARLGRNPARIMSAWHDFVDAHPGERVAAIGEPVWPGRSANEIVECQHHEALLNLAFDDADFELLCPYDALRLDEDVMLAAERSHPHISANGGKRLSDAYLPHAGSFDSLAELGKPVVLPDRVEFDGDGIAAVRRLVARRANEAGIDAHRAADLVIAASELATNSVRHGGGAGVLRVWIEDAFLVCEVSDHGRIDQPLVGRRRPSPEQLSGRGIWIVHQLCDLSQIRSGPGGSVVRLHMATGRAA